MPYKQFTIQNLRHYSRYYILIALAVALANTIITGSLMVGDSVRQTLISRVDERLGRTIALVSSGTGFMDDAFAETPTLKGSAATVFFTNGFVPHGLSLFPVSVWGVDSSLTAIVAQDFIFPDAGEVVINRKTANELSLKAGDDLVVRLHNTRMIPSGSLFVSDNYTASLRLKVKAVIDNRQSGNLNQRNEQSLPFNLFINRQELVSELEMDGKCNIIMLNRKLSNNELAETWKPDFSGIEALHPPKEGLFGESFREVVSERVFLEKDLIDRLDERFSKNNHLFSYLVNDISRVSPHRGGLRGASIPYSFVTAIDHFADRDLTDDDIILSDYAARRLNASTGDTVMLTFFVSTGLKTLSEEQRTFVVRDILSLKLLQTDGRLSANFPGLSNVDNCTDWDSDLPINMERITKEDEEYWDLYRSTPKALISYAMGASLWGNNYGVATAVRVSDEEDWSLSEILSPSDAGIVVVSPREAGLAAAREGVDFKSLFLSLAFFVIAAALLLATIPLGGMLHDRRKELLLLQALGYTHKRIQNILLNEMTFITIIATLAGVFAAVLYNSLVLYALGNIWKGAVHTENFIVGIEPASLIGGSLVSLFICFVTVWLTLRRILYGSRVGLGKSTLTGLPNMSGRRDNNDLSGYKVTDRVETKTNKKFHKKTKKNWLFFIFLLLLMHVLIVVNFTAAQSPVLYMATGLVALAVSILGYARFVSRKASKTFNQKSIVYKNLNYRRRNGVISVAVLASGLFVVFSVGLNRKSFADASSLASGTGGFTLWGENSVPLYHSLSTPEGRERFGLSDLPAATSILQFYRRGGDDASCLNLNKALQPTVLGVDAARLADASFTFSDILETHNFEPETLNLKPETSNLKPETSNIWFSLSQKRGDFYPVIADQTVLQWGLMKSVGDTITYLNRRGEPVVLQFIGGLNNSIFQGNLLMDKVFFTEIWGEDGSEVMLVQTPDSTQMTVKQILSQALANYGLRLEFCNERLKEFNSVTDSYLTIFLMLGGLGLLIGLFGMLLIIRRGLLNRVREISTLSAIGFNADSIKRQLFRESMTVPVYAVAAGTVAALVSVTSAIPAVSLFTWATMLAILLLLLLIAWWFTKKMLA